MLAARDLVDDPFERHLLVLVRRQRFGLLATRGGDLAERVGDFDVRGAPVVLELVLDDYAEIWVDGRLPVVLGQTGGQLITGFNAPNRVVLTRNARPGPTRGPPAAPPRPGRRPP